MVLLLAAAALALPFRLSRMRLPALSFAFALFFPPVYIVATHAVLYDNIRHVLFVIPLLAVVAGMALDRFDRLLRPAKAQRIAAWVVAGAFLIYHAGVMVDSTPTSTSISTPSSAACRAGRSRFDLDFWSNSLAETTTNMVSKVVATEGPAALTKPYTVAICGPTLSASYYLPSAWHSVDAEDEGIFARLLHHPAQGSVRGKRAGRSRDLPHRKDGRARSAMPATSASSSPAMTNSGISPKGLKSKCFLASRRHPVNVPGRNGSGRI